MDSIEVKERVSKILETFGMKGDVAGKAMHVTTAVFRHKNAGSVGHRFTEPNLADLIAYIKAEAEKL